MALFEVRLEAQDGSGHYRITRLQADDADAARKQCERKELELVLYQLTPADEQAVLKAAKADTLDDVPHTAALDAPAEEKAAFRALSPEHRAKVHAHRQEEPYAVVSVEEVEK